MLDSVLSRRTLALLLGVMILSAVPVMAKLKLPKLSGFNPVGSLVSDFVFGPTIDQTEAAGKRVVDYGHDRMDALLTKHEQIIGNLADAKIEKLADVSREVSSEVLADLSTQVNQAIEKLDESNKENFSLLMTGAYAWMIKLRSSFGQFWAFGVLAFSIVAAWVVYITGTHRRRWGIILGIVAPVCAGMVGFILVKQWEKRSYCALALENARLYEAHWNQLNMSRALRHMLNLQLLSAGDSEIHQLAVEKIKLIRRVFSDPSAYKKAIHAAETLEELSVMNDRFVALTGKIDPDVRVAMAVVIWHTTSDRFAEHIAASHAATALATQLDTSPPPPCNGGDQPTKWVDSSPFAFVALHYLSAYLANPLTDDQLNLAMEEERWEDDVEPVMRLPQLFRERETASAALAARKPPAKLGQFLAYSDAAIRIRRQAIPYYVASVHFFMSAVLDAGNRREYKSRSNESGDRLVQLYTEEALPGHYSNRKPLARSADSPRPYLDRVIANEKPMLDLNSILASLHGPLVLVDRVAAITDEDPRPSTTRTVLDFGKDGKLTGFHEEKGSFEAFPSSTCYSHSCRVERLLYLALNEVVRPRVGNRTFTVMQKQMWEEGSKLADELYDFEEKYLEFLRARQMTGPKAASDIRRTAFAAAYKASKLGLFACTIGTEDTLFWCDPKDASTIPLAEIIHDLAGRGTFNDRDMKEFRKLATAARDRSVI